MTAYLTLKQYSLRGAQDGFTITATATDVQNEAADTAENQSGVAVAAGEQLTERQLLEAPLIPSGNNIAQILAAQVAGSEASLSPRWTPRPARSGWTRQSTPTRSRTSTRWSPMVSRGKTGSDSAAGGCLASFTNVTVGGRPVTAAGVVLGQDQGSNTSKILAAAGNAAERLVQSAVSTSGASPPGVLGPGGALTGAVG